MHGIPRHAILILLLGVALLAPMFEFFDQGQDLEQGSDFVLVLLSVFVSTGLFVLCTRIVTFLFRLLVIALIPADTVNRFPNRSIEVEVSPPERLMMLGSLLI